MATCYVTREIPLTEIDRINRRAAATGSVWYARATEDADYNGHPITVAFKPHAMSGPTWNAEYWWGGRVVLGRGKFRHCLDAALREYARGHRGCLVVVCLDEAPIEEREADAAACEAAGLIAVPDGVNARDYACAEGREP